MLASAANLTDAMVLLIDAGACIDSKDLDGNSALTLGYMHASTDAIKLLEARGADINITNNCGRNPLEESGRRIKAKPIFFN
jgi:ankyrin repeat protein